MDFKELLKNKGFWITVIALIIVIILLYPGWGGCIYGGMNYVKCYTLAETILSKFA
jgi:hypothetical protein